jgi:hypothetical protein
LPTPPWFPGRGSFLLAKRANACQGLSTHARVRSTAFFHPR